MSKLSGKPILLHTLISFIFVIGTLLLYMSNGRYQGGGDMLPAELLPISILHEGNLDFEEFGDNLERGYMFERVKGHVISFYPVVPGLLNVPAHIIANIRGDNIFEQRNKLAKWTSTTVTALSVGCMYLAFLAICSRCWTPFLMAVLYATGTCTWSVTANGLWQHGPSLLFLSAGIACLVSERAWLVAIAGLWFGLAVFNRPSNAVFLAPVWVYLFIKRPQSVIKFSIVAILPLLAMGWYSWTYWGTPLSLGQGHHFTVSHHGQHATYFTFFSSEFLQGITGTLLSPNRGLFVFSPFLIITVPLAIRLVTRIREQHVLLLPLAIGAGLHLLLHASWSVWWGGWSFGYRLLIEMLPSLMLLTATAWERWIVGHGWRIAGFTVLAIWSVYVHFLGAYFYPSGWNKDADINRHPMRCWSTRDTELLRLHRIFIKRLGDINVLRLHNRVCYEANYSESGVVKNEI